MNSDDELHTSASDTTTTLTDEEAELQELRAAIEADPRVEVDEDKETAIVQLRRAISHDGDELASVKVRAPMMGDVERAMRRAKGDHDQPLHMLSVVTGLPVSALRKMRPNDFLRCTRAMDYLGNL
jgi:hypothetical protein